MPRPVPLAPRERERVCCAWIGPYAAECARLRVYAGQRARELPAPRYARAQVHGAQLEHATVAVSSGERHAITVLLRVRALGTAAPPPASAP